MCDVPLVARSVGAGNGRPGTRESQAQGKVGHKGKSGTRESQAEYGGLTKAGGGDNGRSRGDRKNGANSSRHRDASRTRVGASFNSVVSITVEENGGC